MDLTSIILKLFFVRDFFFLCWNNFSKKQTRAKCEELKDGTAKIDVKAKEKKELNQRIALVVVID